MKIYLVRHGEALTVEQDVQRGLSEKGRVEIQKDGEFLKKNKISVDRIYHSGKLRAAQTAEILANYLVNKPGLQVLSGLLPDDSVRSVAVCCNHWDDDIMLVGHLPFMPKLVSSLILDRDDINFVDFATGSILCLERKGQFYWSIEWLIDPSLL